MATVDSVVRRIRTAAAVAAWETRRRSRTATRRFGWVALAVAVSSVVSIAGLCFVLVQQHLQRIARSEIAMRSLRPAAGNESFLDRGRSRIQAFYELLPPEEDIPDIIQSVLGLAREEGLSIQRGEYRPEVDAAGGFMRFRMSLPIKGEASKAVHFLQSAMHSYRTLALEGVRFSRPSPEAAELEVHVDWVLLTRLSSKTQSAIAGAGPAPGRVGAER